MLRPIGFLGQRITEGTSRDFIRTKVVRAASILKPAEKIKLWHRESKELFGPLLETNKQKQQRNKKTTKNSKKQSSASDSELKLNYSAVCSPPLQVELFRRKMLQNTRTCVNFIGVLLNKSSVRCIQTYAPCQAAKSSPAQPGLSSEDKILQIRQHTNDYAQQYPSVTLVLNKTMTDESRTALDKWKQERIAELGEQEFNKFYQAQMAVGTKFHSTLKDYFTQPRNKLIIEKDVQGVWNSVADVLKSISSPKAIESNVVHPMLKYRGIFDAIADYEDKPTLIEWKKSDKPRRSILLTYDNPVQLAAYFGAVCNDGNYKHLNVRDALLVIAYTDGSKADTFHLSTDKLREHWAQWLIRLENFTKRYGNDAEKQLKGGKRLFEEDIGNLQ